MAKSQNKELYYYIKDRDLLANDFQVHKCCYLDFTKHFCEKEEVDLTDKENVAPQHSYDQGDFEKVVAFIKREVLEKNSVVPLKMLHEMYGIGLGDSRYRTKLRDRIVKEFGTDVAILTDSTGAQKKVELVMSSDCVESSGQINRPEYLVRRAGEILRQAILEKFNDKEMENWPPSIDELSKDEWKPPAIVENFVESLLCSSPSQTPKQKRWIDSLSSDIVHQVTNGKTMQLKQLVVAMGLTNLTGSRERYN